MIKAIVFDLGGVLLDLDLEACWRSCRENLGFEKVNEIVGASHQKGIFEQLERGAISADEFYDGVLAMCSPGKTREDIPKAFEPFIVGIAPYKVQLIKDLSQKYDLYMLSNNNAMSTPICLRRFKENGLDVPKYFKHLFISYQMKLLKPGDEIYQETIRGIQNLSGTPEMPILPKEMLFIDDSLLNVEAALRNGMNAAHYTQGSDLKKLLSDNGVEI